VRDASVAEAIAVKPRYRGLSHYYGLYVSLVVGAVLVATGPRGLATWTAAVYALSVSGMLGASALLHRGRWSAEQARVLTKVDHTGIYLLIAGSYTPISLLAMSGVVRAVVFSAVWLGAFVGIALEWIWYRPPKGLGDGRLHHVGMGGDHRHPPALDVARRGRLPPRRARRCLVHGWSG
jgi:hemolysin III